jgi:hypothetical protein
MFCPAIVTNVPCVVADTLAFWRARSGTFAVKSLESESASLLPYLTSPPVILPTAFSSPLFPVTVRSIWLMPPIGWPTSLPTCSSLGLSA